jgi:hypothetical protein
MTLDAIYRASYNTGSIYAAQADINIASAEQKLIAMRRDIELLTQFNNHIMNANVHVFIGWLCGYHNLPLACLKDVRMIAICLSDCLLLNDIEQLESRWKGHLNKLDAWNPILFTIINFVLHDMILHSYTQSSMKYKVIALILNTFQTHLSQKIQSIPAQPIVSHL